MGRAPDPFRPGARVRFGDTLSLLGQVCLRDARTVTVLADDGSLVRHVRDKAEPSDEALPAGARAVSPPRRGARVAVESGGALHPGVVDAVADSGACAVSCDDGLVRRGHAGLLHPCATPAPARHRRGDRVTWTERGRALAGTVVGSGAARVKVRRDGGRQEVSGPQGAFSPEPAAPAPDGAASAWEVTRFSRAPDGPLAFEATVRDGRGCVLSVSKPAGAASAVYLRRGEPGGVRGFVGACSGWASDNGRDDLMDPVAAWVWWKAALAPYGVLASDHLSCKDGVPSPSDDEDGASHPWARSP